MEKKQQKQEEMLQSLLLIKTCNEICQEEMLEGEMWNKKDEKLEEKMSEERRWKEDTLRKLANIQMKKVDQTRRKECLREKGEISRNSEENFNAIEVLVSRDGYNLID